MRRVHWAWGMPALEAFASGLEMMLGETVLYFIAAGRCVES